MIIRRDLQSFRLDKHQQDMLQSILLAAYRISIAERDKSKRQLLDELIQVFGYWES